MKTTKLMVIAGLSVSLMGLSNLSSTTARAASVKTIQKVQTKAVLQKVSTHYNSKAKSLHISGLATQGNKVVVKYGTKKLATTNINAKHEFDTKVKFTGYKTISLYAVNKANKRVTPIVKLTANRYAAPTPTVEKSHRTSKAINYDLTTAKNKGTLVFYYQGKKFYSQKVKSTKTRISFTQDQLKGKKGNFTVRYFQTSKKASPAVKAPIVKVGSVTQIFY